MFSSVTCIYDQNSQWAKFISSPETWVMLAWQYRRDFIALHIYFLFIYSAKQ